MNFKWISNVKAVDYDKDTGASIMNFKWISNV